MCKLGTVQVTGFMTVKERGSAQHLGSSVSGVLAPGRTSVCPRRGTLLSTRRVSGRRTV